MSGLFITLEGPDGSGKSTMLRKIREYLKERGTIYTSTREPGGTDIGEDIRRIILDKRNKKMSYEAEALLYAASRGQHVYERIIPAMKENKVVLCDRFLLSSLAYQGIGRDLGIERVKMINDFALRGLYPDLILFFKVDPKDTLKRKTRRSGGDRLEGEGGNFHQKVYEGYLKLIKMYPKNVKIIDATKSLEDVRKQCIMEVENLLKEREC